MLKFQTKMSEDLVSFEASLYVPGLQMAASLPHLYLPPVCAAPAFQNAPKFPPLMVPIRLHEVPTHMISLIPISALKA